jgi:dTDP-4-amino-4,6-dideoxygalactose transaminase
MPSCLNASSASALQAGSEVLREDATPFHFLDLKAQFEGIRGEVMQAISRVMDSQAFILGSEVQAFENEMAETIGVGAAVGCASGSDALLLALMALGVGPGDEVIVPPFTFVATAGSVARLGARPVFVDILPDTFNIDPAQVESAITLRTRAIIPVHLFGLPAEMDTLLKVADAKRLAVIEDAAQAIGACYRGKQVGSLSHFGCFSFYPSKNLGGAGDGGLITTNSAEMAERLRVLRAHGGKQKYSYELIGMNSRLDALQAAILRVKLTHLGSWAKARQRNADRYRAFCIEHRLNKFITLPSEPADCRHVYNQFTIRSKQRDHLQQFLRGRGIPTEIYYPHPLHLQPAFSYLGCKEGQFPHSETASREALSLPIYPELKEEQQAQVIRTIAEFYGMAD